MRTCPNCQRNFEPKRPNQQYCTPRCTRQTIDRRNKRKYKGLPGEGTARIVAQEIDYCVEPAMTFEEIGKKLGISRTLA